MNRNEGMFVNVANSPYVQPQDIGPAASNSSRRPPKKRFKSALFNLGVMEIITGCLCLILGVTSLVIASSNKWYNGYDHYSSSVRPYRLYHDFTYPGQGIWGGVFAIVVGIVGVKARGNPSQCMYNANMALSIIGAIVMGALTILSCVAAKATHTIVPGLIAVHVILASLGFFGVVIMIIHSAYCCAGVCRKHASYERVAVSYHPGAIGMQQPQLIQLANGQYVLAPTQMIVTPYPMAQVPVVGAPVAYHQPSQSITPPQMPGNQCLQTQMAPVFVSVNAAPPQAVACTTQQTAITNPQQTAQARKEQEVNDDPPEYSGPSGN